MSEPRVIARLLGAFALYLMVMGIAVAVPAARALRIDPARILLAELRVPPRGRAIRQELA